MSSVQANVHYASVVLAVFLIIPMVMIFRFGNVIVGLKKDTKIELKSSSREKHVDGGEEKGDEGEKGGDDVQAVDVMSQQIFRETPRQRSQIALEVRSFGENASEIVMSAGNLPQLDGVENEKESEKKKENKFEKGMDEQMLQLQEMSF